MWNADTRKTQQPKFSLIPKNSLIRKNEITSWSNKIF